MRAHERPLLAFDQDDWAIVIPSAAEADGHLEPVDVLAGEYRVFTLDGHVVDAHVVDDRVMLRETGERDLGALHQRLATLVRRYELASSPDDPMAVTNELLRRDWDGRTTTWLQRFRTRCDGPDIVQPPAADERLIDLLRERDGQRTVVELNDGRQLTVVNIAWGYDMGDEYAHVITNGSPDIEGEPMELFFTDEVRRVLDPDREQPLWP